MSRPTARRLAALALLVAAGLAGCTVPSDAPDGTQRTGAGGGEATETAGPTGEDAEEPALTSEEISARLLDEGDALAATEPVASVSATLPVSPAPTELTLDVLSVEATATGTLVTLQVSAAAQVSTLNTTFVSGEIGNTEYPTEMELLDPTTQERLAPVTAADGGRWCQCSFLPPRLGPDPVRVSAGFPALAEGTTSVDLRLGAFPVLEDLPVTR